MSARAGQVCLLGGLNKTGNSGSEIVAREKGNLVTNHRRVRDVLANTHQVYKVRSVCKRIFCLDNVRN